MNADPSAPKPSARVDPASLPKPRWWGKFEIAGNPPERRFVVRWKRILLAGCGLGLGVYLALVTALWGYYALDRKIPGVNWIDVAILPRFSRVQNAIGASYFANAQEAWKKKDYVTAIFTARAAVQKAPTNLDARLFLAGCWSRVGRNDDAIRTLRDGVKYDATDERLQQAAIGTALEANRYKDVLELLREDFPAHGVRLLEGKNWLYILGATKAILETEGAAKAEEFATSFPQLNNRPEAAPLLANIELQLGRGAGAIDRLKAALAQDPKEATVLSAYANMAETLGRNDEAKVAAQRYLDTYPFSVDAQLIFLQALGSRSGADHLPWTEECLAFLSLHRREPDALARLASLSAENGWTDLALLLYENSLQENLNGMPFAIYYSASLVKAGDAQGADTVWKQLALRNSTQLATASYIEAMVDWGVGRESDGMQIIDRLKRETTDDPTRRHMLQSLFRRFGYPKLADRLADSHA
jgi:predicted Zn-dependent protease